MKAKSRTKEELIQELEVLRRRVASMEESKDKGEPEEEAQRDGEERYRLLFEGSRDAMFITSVDGKVVEVNQAMLDIFGYTREEAMRLPVLDAYAHPEDRHRFQQELQKKGSARDYEVPLRKKDGTEMDCLVSATVRRAKDGSILGYHGIIRDITERKRMEEALRASEAKFRRLFENVAEGVYHSTPDGNFLAANPALVQMLGYDSEEELRSVDIARDVYVNPEDRTMLDRNLEDQGRVRNVELNLKRKDGQQVIVLENSRAVRDEQGRVIYYEGTATDITERKRAEEALRASEAKFRGLFENLLEGVYQSSPDGRQLTANPAFVRMMGYQSEEELLAVDARERWANLEDRDRWIQQLEQRGELRNIELVLKRKDGQHVTVLESDRLVCDEQGEILYREGLVTDITERKRVEEALRASEAKFRGFFENVPEGVYQCDPYGKFLAANPAFVQLLGYQSEEELLGVNGREMWANLEDRETYFQQLKGVGELRNIELTLKRKDGQHVTVLENDRLIRDEKGEILYIEGALTDITERKRAEEALRASEAKFRGLFENLLEGVYQSSLEGRYLTANPAFVRMMGYQSEEELLAVDARETWASLEDRDRWIQHMEERGELRNIELVLKRKDGQHFTVLENDRVVRDEQGKILYREGLVTDITERKRAEEALRESETMLRQSEKMAVLGTLTAGVAHELNNPAAAVKSGVGQLEAAIVQFEQAQSQLRRLDLTAAQQSELQHLTHEVLEQAARPPELNALARSDREGELETWLEEHGMPDAWKLAPTLVNLKYDAAGLTALAESFAPDQLSAIISSLDATYAVHSLLKEIGQSTGRISEIVKALKSYSYLDQAPVQAVDVHEGLDNTLLVLGHKLKSGISVRQEYAHHLPNIQANGSELNQVWTNIIDNAADALGEQGEITIRTRQEGEWVVIEIEDDGPGIPAEIQPRIFEPFFTTKPPGQGTGLGLDISYNIVVHKHRGNIKVVSEPGKTCFQVWLPVTPEAG